MICQDIGGVMEILNWIMTLSNLTSTAVVNGLLSINVVNDLTFFNLFFCFRNFLSAEFVI